ncbi:GntR family transcriptional regulator [Henriciella aquimarina]|uniref:GntR family transcriptional regulator n=1 Tax=Henriciella aquimarina TaxID=545261 RepID=UPI001301DCA0|nr:GntR family transcriptional regulator [Henriciella aquimarina]
MSAPETQVEQVIARLRRNIVSARLMPGAKLNIATLAQEVGVSAGAVREGLAALQAEGLVQAEPRRGFRVAGISRSDLSELTEARVAIERLCLEGSIKRGGIDWESNCRRAFESLSEQSVSEAAGMQAHERFHHALVSACGNRWLLKMQRMLYAQSERYRHLSIRFASPSRDVLGEHGQILDAVLSRDTEKATTLLDHHLRETARQLLQTDFLT